MARFSWRNQPSLTPHLHEGEPRPILLVVVDHKRDIGVAPDVTHSRQLLIRNIFGFFVEHADDDGLLLANHREAERHYRWMSTFVDRRQPTDPGVVQHSQGIEFRLFIGECHDIAFINEVSVLGFLVVEVGAEVGDARHQAAVDVEHRAGDPRCFFRGQE